MLSATRNPLYLVLILLALIILQTLTTPAHKNLAGFTLRFAASVITISSLFNLIISRFGETVLFRLPESIPLLGGPFTLEALVYGATNGLVLVGMFTLFTILNQVIPVRALVRLIPQAFEPIAVVTTIAITFIPATQKQFNAIREAQAVRGQQVKGLRDWLPLIIPLVTGGLERAMQIAEAMTARGFSGQQAQKPSSLQRLFLPAGLALVVAGWLLQLAHLANAFLGWSVMLLGMALMLVPLLPGRQSLRKTHYDQEKWNLASSLVLFFSILSAGLISLPLPGAQTLVFNPYPRLLLPAFSVWQALIFLIILVPLFLAQAGSDD